MPAAAAAAAAGLPRKDCASLLARSWCPQRCSAASAGIVGAGSAGGSGGGMPARPEYRPLSDENERGLAHGSWTVVRSALSVARGQRLPPGFCLDLALADPNDCYSDGDSHGDAEVGLRPFFRLWDYMQVGAASVCGTTCRRVLLPPVGLHA
eukprot:223346-Chlamydomonas_euryale.AAC.1